MATKAYSVGNALGRHWLLLLIVALAGTGAYFAFSGNESTSTSVVSGVSKGPAQPTPGEIAKARELKATEERTARCTTGAAALRESAASAMKANDPQKAFEILNPCNNLPIDAETKALLVKALNAARENDEKAEKLRLAAERKQLAAEKAKRKKEGVHLGMTQQEVIDSSWGKPRSINRSTYTFGTREQWVYGSGNYLYFKDGILNSIQN